MMYKNNMPTFEQCETNFKSAVPCYENKKLVYENTEPDYSYEIDFTTCSKSIQPLFRYFGAKRKLLQRNVGIAQFFSACEVYIEPFFGAGSAYCYMYNNNLFRRAIINDIDGEIASLYLTIRDNVYEFVECLVEMGREFPNRADGITRQNFIYNFAERYHNNTATDIERVAIYYVLRRNWFNGSYKGGDNKIYYISNNGPHIFVDVDNIMNWHVSLQCTDIMCGSYQNVPILENSSVYVDPPYYDRNADKRTGYRYDFYNSQQIDCIDWCKTISGPKTIVTYSNANSETIRALLDGHADIYEMRLLYATARRYETEILAVFR